MAVTMGSAVMQVLININILYMHTTFRLVRCMNMAASDVHIMRKTDETHG